jgi:hypothetical protein
MPNVLAGSAWCQPDRRPTTAFGLHNRDPADNSLRQMIAPHPCPLPVKDGERGPSRSWPVPSPRLRLAGNEGQVHHASLQSSSAQASQSPRPLSRLALERKVGCGAWDQGRFKFIRGPLPQAPPLFLPYRRERGFSAPRQSLGQGPDLQGSSPSSASVVLPIRHRPLHAHPVHDPCSRDGDGSIMREAQRGVDNTS